MVWPYIPFPQFTLNPKTFLVKMDTFLKIFGNSMKIFHNFIERSRKNLKGPSVPFPFVLVNRKFWFFGETKKILYLVTSLTCIVLIMSKSRLNVCWPLKHIYCVLFHVFPAGYQNTPIFGKNPKNRQEHFYGAAFLTLNF